MVIKAEDRFLLNCLIDRIKSVHFAIIDLKRKIKYNILKCPIVDLIRGRLNRGEDMLQNKDIETLRMLFSSHNYVMTTAELTASKLYYADIKQLLDEGLIERVRRGYYHWTQDYGESEVVIINRLFPDAVLCMETALFYYRYSDRNPAEWNFAIDKNVSKRRTKIDYPFIKAYRVESELVTLGETEGEIDFHKVRIYDRDRTICDVLRNMNKIDKEVFNKAVQGYVKDPKKNIPNLIEYAKALRVQTRVKELIGVWL